MNIPNKNNRELIPVTESALKVRNWEKTNLPIEQSALAMDLFLVIAYNTLRGKPLTLKLLFHSIDFSEAGIRKHLRRMLSEGWCALEGTKHRLDFVLFLGPEASQSHATNVP